MVTNLLQKRWRWQGERNPVMSHGSVVRPTASLDIKTAFDEVKPKHVAKILDDHNAHGWLIAALLREMPGLEGKAMLAALSSTNACDKEAWNLDASGRKWPLRFWPMWKRNGWRKEVVFSWTSKVKELIKFAKFMWADNFWIMSHSQENLEEMLRDLIAEASRWDLVPKPASLWWTSTYDSEERNDMILGTSSGCYKFPFEDKFKMLGCAVNRQGENVRCCRRKNAVSKAFWKGTLICKSKWYAFSESKEWRMKHGSTSRQERATWPEMDTDGFAFPAWKIEESKWRTMGWACDEKSNAVINSLQKVYWWRSTRWWHSLQTRKMERDPGNHTRWKHKWACPQSWTCVGQNRYETGSTNKEKYTWGEVPIRHVRSWQNETFCWTRKEKSKGLGKKVKDKTSKNVGHPDTTVYTLGDGPTVHLCGDSDVACKWINGEYSLGHKYRGRIGQVQKTLHSWWKENVAEPISNIDRFMKHVFREHNQEADHWANIGAQGQRKIVLDRRNDSVTWKATRGASGMEASKTMAEENVVLWSKGRQGKMGDD